MKEWMRAEWAEGLSPQWADKGEGSGLTASRLTISTSLHLPVSPSPHPPLVSLPSQELITNLLDLAIDVPQVWDNLASLVSLLVRLGMTPYEWLQALARQSLPEEPDFIRSVQFSSCTDRKDTE